MAGVSDFFAEKMGAVDINTLLYNLIIAILLLVIGIFLGKFVYNILKKGAEKSSLNKTMKPSFINLFITIIKWSIYILFVNLALNRLNIPQLTYWITSILVVIPAVVGALLLIVIGFAIAVYLRELIEESSILGWETLSMIFYYFVLLIFLIFAFKTALILIAPSLVNTLVIILVVVASIAVAYSRVAKKK